MVETIQGDFRGEGLRMAIVAARFNEFTTRPLVEGAVDALLRHGVAESDVLIVRTPGAFEIPLVARRLAESGKHHAVICVGTILRGQTPHFDVVAGESAKGIATVMLETGVPILNGIVTADTLEQAIDRAGLKAGNKGADAAVAAIEMANLMRALPASGS